MKERGRASARYRVFPTGVSTHTACSLSGVFYVVLLVPEEVVATEGDPPTRYCVERVLPFAQDLRIRVEIVDADGMSNQALVLRTLISPISFYQMD